jgi:rSAM/selenodomain-associated transferase 1
MMTPSVLLMLKAPREGFVKTRLAEALGFPAATRAYRRLVEHQLRQIPAEWPVHIHFAPADARREIHEWLGDSCESSPQPEGDLGARLIEAMRSHFARAATPVIFLGGDCPYLTTERLTAAAALLAESDAALVPALDGGYCLLALRRPEERVFASIAWSTNQVADETRSRLREVAMSWRELDSLEDVDDAPSWNRAIRAFPDLADDRNEPLGRGA